MNALPFLAQTTTSGGGLALTIGYLVVMVGLFYFLAIRPQKKKQKAHDIMLTTISAGDSVLTSSGFYGVIIDVMEEVVIVEFGNNKNCRIPMKKDAIVEIEKPETAAN
ncbi:preprotein translocase subunit YajC [Mobilisporobacter senegalensis]|uniref:Preprotein translocase subunit YajC n=1 Tax=Mobilisporobacter senegalensis TaxID=1329262 RepID=A0A3N1XET8_9FIRM|nr:preprotein translocase subunit YajC [Mobilisporobacter senegalensis]ROR25250.1 preprotein translocase subunit YajC [Mobilisporobacter senegalensis]